LPVHPANTKANNRAMILIRAIPFCQVSKQGRRREWNAIMELAFSGHLTNVESRMRDSQDREARSAFERSPLSR
jgi:hypothetical protein